MSPAPICESQKSPRSDVFTSWGLLCPGGRSVPGQAGLPGGRRCPHRRTPHCLSTAAPLLKMNSGKIPDHACSSLIYNSEDRTMCRLVSSSSSCKTPGGDCHLCHCITGLRSPGLGPTVYPCCPHSPLQENALSLSH